MVEMTTETEMDGPQAVSFGGFTLDAVHRALTRDGERVALRPKSFDVLCCLVAAAGRSVTRDEIVRTVWPKVIVTDESLSRCVSDIRQALDDDQQDLIKTLHRHGYVFTATLTPVPASSPAEARTPDSSLRSPGGSWHALQKRPSIAVLPFTNVGGDREQDYFSDGLTEDIAIRLSKFGELFVIASESAFTFKGNSTNPREIGRRLGARYIVFGAVRRDQARVRISARLVETDTSTQVWGDIYERDLAGVIALQDELAQRIVGLLVSRLTQTELARAQRKAPASLGAYDLFLRGRSVLASVDTSPVGEYGGRLLAARRTLDDAVQLDPGYAPALTALSDTYNRAWLVANDEPALAGEFQNPSVSDQALSLAERAIAADPTLAEGHSQLAWVLHWRYRRGDALAAFRRANDLNPNMADGRYALALAHAGHADESIVLLNRIFPLDPLPRPIYFSYLANSYYLAGRYPQALETSRTTVDRLPAVFQARVWHAAAAAQLGLDEEARAAAAAALRLRPNFTISGFLGMIRLSNPRQELNLEEGLRKAGLPV
jgi:adenylate cyclase